MTGFGKADVDRVDRLNPNEVAWPLVVGAIFVDNPVCKRILTLWTSARDWRKSAFMWDENYWINNEPWDSAFIIVWSELLTLFAGSLSIFLNVGNLDRLSFEIFPDFLDVQFPIDDSHELCRR